MAKALFINRTDIIDNSFIDGNLDTSKLLQYIYIAQDVHIRNYLGSKLYNKISADIVANTLTGDYLTLVNDYIKPMLIKYGMVEYLPYASISLKNGGVFRHTSENSETVPKEEIDFLIKKEKDLAEYYARRFVDFMYDNYSLFPEYNDTSNSDIYPDKDTNSTNWIL